LSALQCSSQQTAYLKVKFVWNCVQIKSRNWSSKRFSFSVFCHGMVYASI